LVSPYDDTGEDFTNELTLRIVRARLPEATYITEVGDSALHIEHCTRAIDPAEALLQGCRLFLEALLIDVSYHVKLPPAPHFALQPPRLSVIIFAPFYPTT
jgi:hypothetical protein